MADNKEICKYTDLLTKVAIRLQEGYEAGEAEFTVKIYTEGGITKAKISGGKVERV